MAHDPKPSVYVLSDSVGETADAVARAALAQFPEDTFHVVRLPKIASRDQLQGVIRGAKDEACVVFYTLAVPKLRDEMARLVHETSVRAVDILGLGIASLADACGVDPTWRAGAIRDTDRGYFERVDALEFAVKHDDGRSVEDLLEAEILLIGVSRTSKTPLSMYLAFKGFKTANVPLVPRVPPPRQLFEVDPRRIFGLVMSSETLIEVRGQRAAELRTYAGRYFEREGIEQELADSRSLMRRLGCIVVSSEGRAIEETAQEILRYYRMAGLE